MKSIQELRIEYVALKLRQTNMRFVDVRYYVNALMGREYLTEGKVRNLKNGCSRLTEQSFAVICNVLVGENWEEDFTHYMTENMYK